MFALLPRRERENIGMPMPRLRDEFRTLYDRFFNGLPMLFEPIPEREYFWRMDVKETEKEVIVWAEIPGFEPAEIDVELRNNRLIIKAEKKHEEEKKEKGYENVERTYERFVELPVPVEPAKVAATYRNGVLEVHLPKAEVAKGLHVPVK